MEHSNAHFSDIMLPDGWRWEPLLRSFDHEDCMGRSDPISHVCCKRLSDNSCRLVFTSIGQASEREGAMIAARNAFALEADEKAKLVHDMALNHVLAQHLDNCLQCKEVRDGHNCRGAAPARG
jgi:hypothetical protein